MALNFLLTQLTYVPASAIPPPEMNKILFASTMVERRCATTSVVRPSQIRRKLSRMCRSVRESRADVASSRRTMLGCLRMVRAMAIRCFSPPLTFNPLSPTLDS